MLSPSAHSGQAPRSISPDPFCGIVNTNLEPTFSPWEFLDKGGSPDFRQGELFEAGINLSDPAVNLGHECFSTFVAETRSSTSTTATLKDFVLGGFQACQPAMTTQASSTGVIAPKTPVTDLATITVTGATNPADPTSPPNVVFFLCGPGATNGCPSSGTPIGNSALVGGANTTDGIATATSPAVNTTTSPLAPGRYCFRAEWAGNSTYPGALSHTNNTTECFSVQDTTAITTAQTWLPQDTASITTGSGGAAPEGTVVFSLYANGTCSGTPTTFSDSSAPYATNNTTVYTESTIISWSATFTPTNTTDYAGSTTTRCERSDLTINNSASDFTPSP